MVLVAKANYVTKQILKEATENILPIAAPGKPELTHSWAESAEGHRGRRAREITCEQRCQERYFSSGPNL